MATKDLYGMKDRTHVPKVIVIVASSEHEKDLYEPNRDEADNFKGMGGHIITIEYTQNPFKQDTGLGKLADEGFSFSFTNFEGALKMKQLLKAFCIANCFCPRHHEPYEYPGNGCFRTINIPAIYNMAARNCEQHYSFMPKVESLQKAKFLNLSEYYLDSL
ncbi:hypothetical protein OESDEN_00926 [Oesophagostomum dentatum]|uniref:Uncharacterized protein n=1 Tax=Oesophagostomum dentatum TaxID=61180 RepID=A0A0B1TTE7_OESDE|nr:hypothetical protein OESDEN_00926 [Oesophagostomum dentatum]